jgi:hypothetical protein
LRRFNGVKDALGSAIQLPNLTEEAQSDPVNGSFAA